MHVWQSSWCEVLLFIVPASACSVLRKRLMSEHTPWVQPDLPLHCRGNHGVLLHYHSHSLWSVRIFILLPHFPSGTDWTGAGSKVGQGWQHFHNLFYNWNDWRPTDLKMFTNSSKITLSLSLRLSFNQLYSVAVRATYLTLNIVRCCPCLRRKRKKICQTRLSSGSIFNSIDR